MRLLWNRTATPEQLGTQAAKAIGLLLCAHSCPVDQRQRRRRLVSAFLEFVSVVWLIVFVATVVDQEVKSNVAFSNPWLSRNHTVVSDTSSGM